MVIAQNYIFNKISVSNENETKTNPDEEKIKISGTKGQMVFEQLSINIERWIARPWVPDGGAAEV